MKVSINGSDSHNLDRLCNLRNNGTDAYLIYCRPQIVQHISPTRASRIAIALFCATFSKSTQNTELIVHLDSEIGQVTRHSVAPHADIFTTGNLLLNSSHTNKQIHFTNNFTPPAELTQKSETGNEHGCVIDWHGFSPYS